MIVAALLSSLLAIGSVVGTGRDHAAAETDGERGVITRVEVTLDNDRVTYRVGVRGLHGTHEVTGRFLGTLTDTYFNADGIFVDDGAGAAGRPVNCPGFTHRLRARRASIEVSFPRTCLPAATRHRTRINLLLPDLREYPLTYLLADTADAGPPAYRSR